MEIISLKDLDKLIKDTFIDVSAQSVNSVYEKTDKGYLLVIDIKNLFYKNVNVIYTKFIFDVDKTKTYLIPKSDKNFIFKYLYDINCNYQVKLFSNLVELKNILIKIIKKNQFGDNIKTLSNFIKSPSTLLNDWFSENNVRNISVYDTTLDERYKIMPCKMLFFMFNINLNDQIDIKFIIKKETTNNYIFTIKIHNKTYEEERTSLNSLISTLGETIKTKYI
jgi:hypothetical protein